MVQIRSFFEPALVARLTLEPRRNRVSMNRRSMRPQTRSVREQFRTIAALKSLDSEMNTTNVHCPTRLRRKTFSADAALERLFAVVQALVIFQRLLCEKGLWTLLHIGIGFKRWLEKRWT